VKLIFELTNLCNFSCLHCIREEPGARRFLDQGLVGKVLREVEPYRMVDHVAFTGGEPTLHPQFAEIAQLVTGQGYRFNFVTNGSGFGKTLGAILPVREMVLAVSFSLDGANETTHDAIRRRPGSYRQVVQGIMLCDHHGIPAQVNMTVTRTNKAEVQEMALLAARLGCAAVGYAHCQPTPDGVKAGLVLDARERLDAEAEIADLQQALRIPLYLAGDHYDESPYFQCPQLRLRELNVDYRGFLTACCTLSSYRGGTPETDAIADLNQVSLPEAHKALIAKIAEVNREKVDRIAAGGLTEADHFICSHCLVHYGKVPNLDQVLLPSAQAEPSVEEGD